MEKSKKLKELFNSNHKNIKIKINKLIKNNKQLSPNKFLENFNYNTMYHDNKEKLNDFDYIQNKEKKRLKNLSLEITNFSNLYLKYKNFTNYFTEKKINHYKIHKKEKRLNYNKYKKENNNENFYKENNNKIIDDDINLFNKSPLLLNDKELFDYYKNKKDILYKNSDKNLEYIEKINEMLNENEKNNFIRYENNIKKMDKVINISKKELFKENENISKYNKEITKLIKHQNNYILKNNTSRNKFYNNQKNYFKELENKNNNLNKKIFFSYDDINIVDNLIITYDKNTGKINNVTEIYEKIKKMKLNKFFNINKPKLINNNKIKALNQIENIYNNINNLKKNNNNFLKTQFKKIKENYEIFNYKKAIKILRDEKNKNKNINQLDINLIKSMSDFK